MNEQHFDALPPVDVNQQSGAEDVERGGKESPKSSEQPGSAVAPAITPVKASADDAVAQAAAMAAIPAMADDVDLIEKEWVEKAKQIVEQTKDDPYKQNQEMTKMKSDYLKKRYNREIKVSEG